MARKAREPKIVRPDDIDPHHRWDRPLQSPGHTQVDFEERINFRRLHDYRLARTRAALANSGLGALLCFDQHNIRYTTSTVIGEWARDKLTRYSLLTGNGDPYIWDFGSAARHHRLHAERHVGRAERVVDQRDEEARYTIGTEDGPASGAARFQGQTSWHTSQPKSQSPTPARNSAGIASRSSIVK